MERAHFQSLIAAILLAPKIETQHTFVGKAFVSNLVSPSSAEVEKAMEIADQIIRSAHGA